MGLVGRAALLLPAGGGGAGGASPRPGPGRGSALAASPRPAESAASSRPPASLKGIHLLSASFPPLQSKRLRPTGFEKGCWYRGRMPKRVAYGGAAAMAPSETPSNARKSVAFQAEIGSVGLNARQPCGYLSGFLEICFCASREAQVNICGSFPPRARTRPPLHPLSRGSGFVDRGSKGSG